MVFLNTLGVSIFLAYVLVYLSENYAGAMWTSYWSFLAVFSLYAVFMAVWIITTKIRSHVKKVDNNQP